MKSKQAKTRVQPDGCTVYFEAKRSGNHYVADFFAQNGDFVDTIAVSVVGMAWDGFLVACKVYAQIQFRA